MQIQELKTSSKCYTSHNREATGVFSVCVLRFQNDTTTEENIQFYIKSGVLMCASQVLRGFQWTQARQQVDKDLEHLGANHRFQAATCSLIGLVHITHLHACRVCGFSFFSATTEMLLCTVLLHCNHSAI